MLSKFSHKSNQLFRLCHRSFSAINPKNILFINSLGSTIEDKQIYKEMNELVSQITQNVKYDICSFKKENQPSNPDTKEWNSYYSDTIIKTIRWAKFYKYDGVIIGDVSMVPMTLFLNIDKPEYARIFENIKVTSLGEAACSVAKNAGQTFSMIIGYKHLIPLFTDNLIKYGYESSFKSFHVLYDGDMNEEKEYYWDRQTILKQTQTAIQIDKCGAVVLASVCDMETCGMIQTKFPKIPIVYPEMAAMKYCEILIDNYRNQGLPKQKDMEDYNDVLFSNSPVGHIIGNTNIDNKSGDKDITN
eukprot:78241_1